MRYIINKKPNGYDKTDTFYYKTEPKKLKCVECGKELHLDKSGGLTNSTCNYKFQCWNKECSTINIIIKRKEIW